jgi:hypothetical protein
MPAGSKAIERNEADSLMASIPATEKRLTVYWDVRMIFVVRRSVNRVWRGAGPDKAWWEKGK